MTVEGPEQGHTFRLTATSRMSSRIHPEGGEPSDYTDADWWGDPPWTIEVRAWNLRDALRKAAELPLSAWDMGRED